VTTTTTTLTARAALAALLLLGLAVAPPAVLAQAAPDAAGLKEVEDDDLRVETLGLTVDQLDGMDVLGPGGKVGEVDDVLADASGRVVAVTVEAGGFLGFGERKVVVGLDQLKNTDGRVVTTMTKDQVKVLPAWNGD
jgi:hypothetical protein